MTRYARAQGSKACNKRQEEDPTPWSVMVRGIRSSGLQDRRREQTEKNPEDFDEADDFALANDDDDDNTNNIKKESSGEESEEEEEKTGKCNAI
jgi:hypothetical protein